MRTYSVFLPDELLCSMESAQDICDWLRCQGFTSRWLVVPKCDLIRHGSWYTQMIPENDAEVAETTQRWWEVPSNVATVMFYYDYVGV